LSIILILEAESFKLQQLTGLTFLPAWLTNLVAACSLAHSMVAYDGGFGSKNHELSLELLLKYLKSSGWIWLNFWVA